MSISRNLTKLAVACLLPLSAAAQQALPVIAGTVLSSEDRQALAGANVFLEGTILGAATKPDGSFTISSVPPGTYSLVISIIGYKRRILSVSPGGEPLTIELVPAPLQTSPVVITANKREQSLDDVPVGLSIVEETQLAYRNTVTIDDALKYVPGVNITRSQVNIRGSTGFSYGVGSQVLLLIDGLPFLTGDTGEIIWESIPAGEIERIEVVKGAGSALYGSSALGGVINIITRRPSDQPETRAKFYGGFYELPKFATWNWATDMRSFSGISASRLQRSGSLTISAGLSRTLDDGYKRNDFWHRWNGWTRLGYDISPFQTLSAAVSVLDQRRGNFLYWKDFDHALEPSDDRLNDRIESFRSNAAVSYKHVISSAASLFANVRWFHSHWQDNLPTPSSPAGSSSRSDALVAEVQGDAQLSAENFLTAGISGSLDDVVAEEIFGVHSAHGGAAFLQDEFSPEKDLRLTLGGRFDFHSIRDLPGLEQFNPKIGLVLRPGPSTSLRASAGRGFRAPSIAEVFTTTEAGGIVVSPNPDLQPERSWSFEIGGNQSIGDFSAADVSLFQNELWNLIEPAFGSDGKVHFENVTHARVTGMEVSLSMSALRHSWITDLSYTYVYPRDVENDQVLKYRPRQLLYLSSKVSLDRTRFGLDYRYVSRFERIDDEFLLIVPGGDQRVSASVVDLHVAADWPFAGILLTSSLQVNNLFQYYYTDFIGNLAPTRNYSLTLEGKF